MDRFPTMATVAVFLAMIHLCSSDSATSFVDLCMKYREKDDAGTGQRAGKRGEFHRSKKPMCHCKMIEYHLGGEMSFNA